MSYETEDITRALKVARKTKGWSQRALSERAGVPQSHISNIEKGVVDLRLSSLLALARVLDLELMLVPRKAVPAVQSIVRASESEIVAHTAEASKELRLLNDTILNLFSSAKGTTQLAQIQRHLRELRHFQIPSSKLEKVKEIRKHLLSWRGNSEDVKALQDSLLHLNKIRNTLAHAAAHPPMTPVRPAYSLDKEDNDA